MYLNDSLIKARLQRMSYRIKITVLVLCCKHPGTFEKVGEWQVSDEEAAIILDFLYRIAQCYGKRNSIKIRMRKSNYRSAGY